MKAIVRGQTSNEPKYKWIQKNRGEAAPQLTETWKSLSKFK